METATKRFTPTLAQEVALLRSSVIGLVGKDSEGKYRPEFVRATLRATTEKPQRRFTTAKAFLSDIKKAGNA
jgi:hypothetical protein